MRTARFILTIVLFSAMAMSAATAADWLRYGGPTADFKLSVKGLASSWPKTGPTELWSRELGGGYAGILVKGDRLYTMFRRGDDEVVTALDTSTGRTLWEHSYEAKPDPSQNLQFGSGPNTSPLIVGDRIFTVGFLNEMRALDIASGELLWSKSLTEEFGTPLLEFGYASSPIPYKNWVIVLTGGEKTGAVGLEPKTGKVAWKAPAIPISYDTPEIATIGKDDQLVFMAPTEVVAVSIERGEVAWRHRHQNQWDTNCVGPWFGDDDLVFVGSSGEAGSRTLRLTDGKTQEVSSNLKVKATTGSVIRDGDTVYAAGRLLMAHDIRSGEILWSEEGYDDANLLQVGSRTLLLNAKGNLTLATLTRSGIEVHATHAVLEDPSLTPPTPSGTRLFLRDQKRIVALELGKD